jgi:hypothetical protein
MPWLSKLRIGWRSLLRTRRVEGELDEEIRFHLEHLVDDHVAEGMSPVEARYKALREMGAIEQRKEECRAWRNSGEDLPRLDQANHRAGGCRDCRRSCRGSGVPARHFDARLWGHDRRPRDVSAGDFRTLCRGARGRGRSRTPRVSSSTHQCFAARVTLTSAHQKRAAVQPEVTRRGQNR